MLASAYGHDIQNKMTLFVVKKLQSISEGAIFIPCHENDLSKRQQHLPNKSYL